MRALWVWVWCAADGSLAKADVVKVAADSKGTAVCNHRHTIGPDYTCRGTQKALVVAAGQLRAALVTEK